MHQSHRRSALASCVAPAALGLALAAWPASRADAQWTVTYLPSLDLGSDATGVCDGEQVGGVRANLQYYHASVWEGSTRSWVDLHPAGDVATDSFAYDTHGNQQVGYISYADEGIIAGIWSGTANSFVSLHPSFAYYSVAYATDGVHQGGEMQVAPTAAVHAVLWTGNAESAIDLHPKELSEYRWSIVNDVNGAQQVGWVNAGEVHNTPHAALWTGTPGSWVDLHPAGADESEASATDGTHQVGFASFGNGPHAGMWTGSAASWVDLNPPNASYSDIADIHDAQQTGFARVGGVSQASIWSGTPGSRVNLHAFLSPEFNASKGLAIWHDSVHTYVAGHGHRTGITQPQALLWIGPLVPADIAPLGGDGQVNVDDLLGVINSWGPCGTPGNCAADIPPAGQGAGNGVVNVDDVLAVINAWGPVQ